MTTKKCFRCKKIKPIDSFYAHPEMTDGHVGKCKSCNKKDVHENYQKKKEYYKDYDKKRESRPERKKQKQLYQKRRRELSKGKYRANSKVNNAIQQGRIKRMPCEVCGDPKSEAHHKDYRKYLSVQWLCFKHHRELHGQKTF